MKIRGIAYTKRGKSSIWGNFGVVPLEFEGGDDSVQIVIKEG